MKYSIIIFVFILLFASCNSNKSVITNNTNGSIKQKSDTIRIVNEQLEYEIIIIDIGFESWLVTQKPITFYENSTLKYRNYLFVTEWNDRVRQPSRFNPNLYEQPIDFNPNIDYGIEVNYKLYMYFLFFQQRYNQRLLYNNWR